MFDLHLRSSFPINHFNSSSLERAPPPLCVHSPNRVFSKENSATTHCFSSHLKVPIPTVFHQAHFKLQESDRHVFCFCSNPYWNTNWNTSSSQSRIFAKKQSSFIISSSVFWHFFGLPKIQIQIEILSPIELCAFKSSYLVRKQLFVVFSQYKLQSRFHF